MKRKILLFMMTALLSVGAWAADDQTLTVGGITQFGDYGLENHNPSESSFTVTNWATVGWVFDTALSQDDYYGVEFTVTANSANAKLRIIYDETYTYTENDVEKTANFEQVIDIPSGTSTIVTHFSYDYDIKKIGFWEHSDNSTDITVTSAVVKAWGNDIPLNVATTNTFSGWGFSYSDNTITVQNWASGGWQFAHPIPNALYSGIDLTFSETAKKLTLQITYANASVYSYEIPAGSTHIAVGFDGDSNISKIGFYHGDDKNSNDVSITITSAVLLSSATGDEVDVKDAASITVNQYGYYTYKTFNPAINIDDYEKVVFTFSSDIPEDALSLQAKIKDGDVKTIGSLIKNGSKVTGYFSNMSSATIESLGFYLNWNSAGTTSVTLNIASAKLYTKTKFVRTITDALYATTSFPAAVDFSQTSGIKAYIAKVNDAKTKVELTEVIKVAAGVPVILNGSATDYTLHYTTESTDNVTGNELLVSDGTVTGDGNTIYVLANGDNRVGFYLVENGSAITAGKAYLRVPAGARQFIGFGDDNGATGIDSLTPALSKGEEVYYDLQGRRVAQPTKGLYIVNGKKVIIK